MVSKMVKYGLLFLYEQKKQGGRVDEWTYKISKASARKYAFDLKSKCKKGGIDLIQYINKIDDNNIDSVAEELSALLNSVSENSSESSVSVNDDKVENVKDEELKENVQVTEKEVVTEMNEKESKELEREIDEKKPVEKKEEKKDEKDDLEEKVSKTATTVGSGRDIIKRNVNRSREAAKLFENENKAKEKEEPAVEQPEPKKGFSFKFDWKIIALIGGAIGVIAVLIMIFKSKKKADYVPVQQTTVSPAANTRSAPTQSGESLIDDSTLDAIYKKLGYELWKP